MDDADSSLGTPEEFEAHHDATLDARGLQHILLATETVEQFLDHLVTGAAKSTGHRCGITVGPPDAPHSAYTVASSDELTRELDELQYAEGYGPCLEALNTSVPVFMVDTATETRWPDYVRQAAQLGVGSSLSYPLHSDGRTIGAINFYAFEPVSPGADLQARAGQLAAVAAGALALALRLAAREDMIGNLRTTSQGRNVKLREAAAEIVTSLERDAPGSTSDLY